MISTLTAALLAGGDSRRMGSEKAALLIDGQPLWRRQWRMLRQLPADAVWLCVRQEPAWRTPDMEVVLDEPPSQGPLSGLAAAFGQLRSSHLLSLAVDLPQMTPAHLEKLWAAARPGCGVIPTQGDYFEPLCAVYPVEAAAVAQQALRAEDASLQRFATKLISEKLARPYSVAPEEKPLYHNLNSPSDLPSGGCE